MKKHLKRFGLAVFILFLILGADTGLYIEDYYHASGAAVASLSEEHDGYTICQDGSSWVFAPEHADTGLIFYPGGKVGYEAYAPLLEDFAEQGIFCVLMKMPGNLAVFDIHADDGVQEKYPEITHWYIGGHSLGGAMAADCVAEHIGEYDGLLLLAAYSTEDLRDSGLKVLSIYGTRDGVLKRGTYEKDRVNLPADFTECIIPGGCHSYFGDYGMQKGDGEPAITREEQMEAVTTAFLSLIAA